MKLKTSTVATFRLSARGFQVNGKPTVTKRLAVDKEKDQMRLAMKAWVTPKGESASA